MALVARGVRDEEEENKEGKKKIRGRGGFVLRSRGRSVSSAVVPIICRVVPHAHAGQSNAMQRHFYQVG